HGPTKLTFSSHENSHVSGTLRCLGKIKGKRERLRHIMTTTHATHSSGQSHNARRAAAYKKASAHMASSHQAATAGIHHVAKKSATQPTPKNQADANAWTQGTSSFSNPNQYTFNPQGMATQNPGSEGDSKHSWLKDLLEQLPQLLMQFAKMGMGAG